MGQTQGSMPAINAAWSQANGRQFIAKLRPDLSGYVYRTTFGKGDVNPDISPVAFLVDRCENVYVSGWGGRVAGNGYPNAGVTGLPVTPDAIKRFPMWTAVASVRIFISLCWQKMPPIFYMVVSSVRTADL
jgi:hypothetical protein